MEKFIPLWNLLLGRTPGSFIEEKNYSLACTTEKGPIQILGQKKGLQNSIRFSLFKSLMTHLSYTERNKVYRNKRCNVNKAAGQRAYMPKRV